MSKYLLKKVCLKTPQLINLRNSIRTILYKKLFATIKEIRPYDKELYTYCYSNKVKLSYSEEQEKIHSIEMGKELNLGLTGKEVIANIQSFLDEMRSDNIDEVERYIKCRCKMREVTRYFQGLDKLIKKSPVMCLGCKGLSKTDMYRMPILGTIHSWEGAWVCPECFSYYRREIMDLYSVDVAKLTERVQLKTREALEIEAYRNS